MNKKLILIPFLSSLLALGACSPSAPEPSPSEPGSYDGDGEGEGKQEEEKMTSSIEYVSSDKDNWMTFKYDVSPFTLKSNPFSYLKLNDTKLANTAVVDQKESSTFKVKVGDTHLPEYVFDWYKENDEKYYSYTCLIVERFYKVLKDSNFTASDGEFTQKFYGENGFTSDVPDQEQVAILRMGEQGIFEAHKLESGDYEVHGMLSPNYELPYTSFMLNFTFLNEIEFNKWKKYDDDEYFFYPSPSDLTILANLGIVGDVNSVEKVHLSENPLDGSFKVIFKYYEETPLTDLEIDVYDIGKTVNEKLLAFSKTTVNPQTSWNAYQLKAMQVYGFENIPFFSTYDLGLKLYFDKIALSGIEVTLFQVYDYLASKADEAIIEDELVKKYGYYKHPSSDDEGIKVYQKDVTSDRSLRMEFKYLTLEEVEADQRIAFPNGYLQVNYSYVPLEDDLTISEMNEIFTNAVIPNISLNSEDVERIYKISYKDLYNNAALYDEEVLAALKEKGLEPGPLYEEYCSIYITVDDPINIVDKLEDFRDDLKDNNFVIREGFEELDSLLITELPHGCIGYDNLNKPYSSVDIYYYDSSLLEYTGTIEILVTKYTELGYLLYFVDEIE